MAQVHRGGVRVGIVGAGAVGCWIGGKLAARGVEVVFLGRDRSKKELETYGLSLTDLDGSTTRVAASQVTCVVDPAGLAACDVALVCVKSAQTAEVAVSLATALPRDAVAVSMQNGVRNQDVLRDHMPDHNVLGGIVSFNVVAKGEGVFRRATSGPLVIEASGAARVKELDRSLSDAGFEVELREDLRAVQWAKLMMNLNNAIGALSDAPTRDLLFVSGYRKILAAVIRESLGVLRKAGVRPARLGAIPVGLFPTMLALPTPILRLVARAQLTIDPEARSSMWDDLSKGRLTEVDYLNGEVVRLAQACGAVAPLNQRIVELVHKVEKVGTGSPKLSPEALWKALH